MKDFFKYTFASLIGSLLGIALIVGLGFGGLIFLVGSIASKAKDIGPQVKDKSVLVFDLATNITDTRPISTTGEALQEALSGDQPATITLRKAINALDTAAQDEKIIGLYIKGSSTPGRTGLANLQEIRQALQRFRETGKKIIAYDVDWTEREYYLGSVADEIVINPLGAIEFNGLSSQTMFLSGAFDKFGIGVQVTRVGKYKSAVEPFIRETMSPENREQNLQLLRDIWGKYLQTIAPSRGLTIQQLQAIANEQGILMADAAEDSKLVDRVDYYDEVLSELKVLTGKEEDDKTFTQISLNNYTRVPKVAEVASGDVKSKNKIAVVYAEGEIVNGTGTPRQIGGDRLAKELRRLRFDDKVKAVVLRVNSPGGSASASEVIGREVKLTREQKPIIVSMGNIAASGGYWISMNADKIFAEPTTITGSIGVFGVLFNIQDLGNENGITWDTVKIGQFADLNNNSRPKTEEELALIQNMVDSIYERFITNVATARNLPKEKVAEIAQGRVWSGVNAQELGLVDEITGIEGAIKFAAEKAELGDSWKVEEYPKSRSLEQRIFRSLSGAEAEISTSPVDPLTAEFQKLQQELASLRAMNDPYGIYTRLPFNLRID
ncbi:MULTISPECIES: signal peptide peptidase SppA [Okeania]|uniref:Protease 4 n=1 Tax=Okeania hirsuta TaxID=1458930 RepID=A0A3N6R7K2_9CYAN|nr:MULTISPECIES: signal peptide peptidase SppA [Okeania]NES78888.1 signal peptide peptidase SppA [Okeania sp. SIO1H4]NES89422.1 signal peptide peptidase SppA [Okeania sp. SIO2B9]NET22398.1 signal peptide peptidase SppA [Okeania sp. SIO1H5]NET79123.1 signal peptide peptidase SppA [Okeania sp. SIO1F9]NET95581.1 signal peptide peptidase SppA [Okeania sp. SIO1H2]